LEEIALLFFGWFLALGKINVLFCALAFPLVGNA